MKSAVLSLVCIGALSCSQPSDKSLDPESATTPDPDHELTMDQKHSKFSQSIPRVLTINAGEVVRIATQEATDGQLTLDSDTTDLMNLSFDPIHPLTGPVFIRDAKPGDILD